MKKSKSIASKFLIEFYIFVKISFCMSLFKYLTSKTFFTQAFIAVAIVVVFTFIVIPLLDFRPNHGQEIKVPASSKMKLEIAEEKLRRTA